jgi:hypothetical protein
MSLLLGARSGDAGARRWVMPCTDPGSNVLAPLQYQ